MSEYYLGVDRDGNVIMHSKGVWKKHKYIQKIGEGANAVYKYAKDKSGVSAKENLENEERGLKYWREENDNALSELQKSDKDLVKYENAYNSTYSLYNASKSQGNNKNTKYYENWLNKVSGPEYRNSIDSKKQAQANYKSTKKRVQTQYNRTQKAKEYYAATPLGKADAAISKGKEKIKKLLGK